MKKRLFSLLFSGVFMIGLVFFVSSCSDKNEDIVETAWNVESFTVDASEWSWNPSESRWQAVKQLDFIDEFVYESGAVIGYVFVTENG